MEKSQVKERVLTFIKHKEVSIRAFEERCGFSNGFVSNITKCIGADKLLSILKSYPELNMHWLINGEGEMLIDGASAPQLSPEQLVEERDAERIRHDEQISQLLNQNSELIQQNKTLTELLRVGLVKKGA